MTTGNGIEISFITKYTGYKGYLEHFSRKICLGKAERATLDSFMIFPYIQEDPEYAGGGYEPGYGHQDPGQTIDPCLGSPTSLTSAYRVLPPIGSADTDQVYGMH